MNTHTQTDRQTNCCWHQKMNPTGMLLHKKKKDKRAWIHPVAKTRRPPPPWQHQQQQQPQQMRLLKVQKARVPNEQDLSMHHQPVQCNNRACSTFFRPKRPPALAAAAATRSENNINNNNNTSRKNHPLLAAALSLSTRTTPRAVKTRR